jgi:hypothetical protein
LNILVISQPVLLIASVESEDDSELLESACVKLEDVDVATLDRLEHLLPKIFPRNLGLQSVLEDVNVSALQDIISSLDFRKWKNRKSKGSSQENHLSH